MSAGDTVVATATPFGESALAVLRISGSLCETIVGEALGVPYPTPRHAHLSIYTDLLGNTLDEIIFLYFSKGKSYTGEVSIEISTHGNPLITKKILDDLVARGCRLAEPGEFTRRAFLSGRIDMTQAESVAALIRAKSDRALIAAQRQLRGALGEKIVQIQSDLVGLRARLEAYVDFPEEDLPTENKSQSIEIFNRIIENIKYLRRSASYGRILNSGIKCLIVGRANAGKSTLFNWFCGEDRAIVSDTPGTTRDYLSCRTEIAAFEVEIIDTAGIREGQSTIEKIGMEKTLSLAETADYFIYVLDSTLPYHPHEHTALFEFLNSQNSVLLQNKSDLPDSTEKPDFLSDCQRILTSLQSQKGFDEFLELFSKILNSSTPPCNDDNVVINSRHDACLQVSENSLEEARSRLQQGSIELSLHDICRALDSLGEIVGMTDNETMLDKLFQNFCIGK